MAVGTLAFLSKSHFMLGNVIAQAGEGDAKNPLLAGLTAIKWICAILGIIIIVAGAMKLEKTGGESGKLGILAGAIIASAPHMVAFLMGDSADSDLQNW